MTGIICNSSSFIYSGCNHRRIRVIGCIITTLTSLIKFIDILISMCIEVCSNISHMLPVIFAIITISGTIIRSDPKAFIQPCSCSKVSFIMNRTIHLSINLSLGLGGESSNKYFRIIIASLFGKYNFFQ